MNNHPFHVGQRVVCVKTSYFNIHPDIGVKKDLVYPVKAIFTCACGLHFVDVGMEAGMNFGKTRCNCKHYLPTNSPLAVHTLFAPINPREVEIDESIIEQAKELISLEETVKQLETVNN